VCLSRLLLRGDDEGFDVLHRLLKSLRGPVQVVDDGFWFRPLDAPLRLRGRCNGRCDLLCLSRRLTRFGQRLQQVGEGSRCLSSANISSD
jgi:hypothetical protein